MAAAVATRPRRRRRGKGQPARCGKCRAPIVWRRLRGSWWKFDPRPVDPLSHSGPPAYPVENKQAWLVGAFVEELMGRRRCSEAEAREEAYAYPWHVIHTCLKKEDQP